MGRRRHSDSDSSSSSDDDRGRSLPQESHGEIETRLESLICRIGEKSTSSLESNLEGLAKVLKSDLANFKDFIIETLACAAVQVFELYEGSEFDLSTLDARKGHHLLNAGRLAQLEERLVRFRIHEVHHGRAS